MKIDFTPTARARLREITRYLAGVNPLAAQKLLAEDEARKTVWVVDVWHGAQLPSRPKLPIAEPDASGR